MAKEAKENLGSAEVDELKDRALDYLKRYMADGETLRIGREDALKAYRRDPYPEDAAIPTGSRSKFVMSDVSDTIEWILPSMMRIFASGKEVVRIEGQGPEDEAGAELLNAKVNWDITRQNNGFLLFYDWFKASMLNKFSVVKYWWDSHEEYTTVEFDEPLSNDAYEQLLADTSFTETSHKENELQAEIAIDDPMMGRLVLQPREVEHEVSGKRLKRRIRRPVAEVVPPEEFICSLKMKDIKEEEFLAHRKRIHKFDLINTYKVSENDLDRETEAFTQGDSEIYERFKDLGGVGFFQDDDDHDFYYIYECYMKDDEREPIILTLMGSKVIKKAANEGAGFCMNSPIRMPHRAIGMSIYDLVGDIQKLRSGLARYNFNNIYYQTEAMLIINPWKINMADFETQRRAGGVVRTKESNVNINEAAWPVPVQPLSGHAVALIETVGGWNEKRTGITSYNQGTDADSLNKTARGISEIMSASQQRVELIARIFAETGVKDLMTAFAQMNIAFLDMETNVRFDNRWQTIDPSQLDILFDVSIDVALGTGSREQKVEQTGAMLDRSMNPTLISSGVVQPQNVYELMKTIYIEMGYKNVDKYLTNPATLMMGAGQPAGVPGGDIGSAQGNGGAPPAGVQAGSAVGTGSPAPVG